MFATHPFPVETRLSGASSCRQAIAVRLLARLYAGFRIIL